MTARPSRRETDGVGRPAGSGPYPWGFGTDAERPLEPDLAEPLRLIGLLRDMGVVMVNVTMGSPYYNPHIGRPFERPPVDGYQPPEHPLVGVARHFRAAAAVQQAYPDLVVVGTGYSWLRHYAALAGEANVQAGRVSMMGLGRGALAYPDFAADLMERGEMSDRKACLGVSYCTALMRAKNNELGQFPTGCVPRDPLYAAQFKLIKGVRRLGVRSVNPGATSQASERASLVGDAAGHGVFGQAGVGRQRATQEWGRVPSEGGCHVVAGGRQELVGQKLLLIRHLGELDQTRCAPIGLVGDALQGHHAVGHALDRVAHGHLPHQRRLLHVHRRGGRHEHALDSAGLVETRLQAEPAPDELTEEVGHAAALGLAEGVHVDRQLRFGQHVAALVLHAFADRDDRVMPRRS